MTSAVKNALAVTRAVANAAAGRALATKQAGGLNLAPGGGYGQFSTWKDQAANERRYAMFRGWVYAAVNALAMEGAGQPVKVGKLKGASAEAPKTRKAAATEMEIIEDHPLQEVLDEPNDIQMKWQFVYSFITNLCLTGWSYVFRDEKDGKPRFYSVPTTWVRPIHTKGPFAEFKIVNPRNPAGEAADSPTFTREQVGFAYLPDPSDPIGGYAPAAAQQAAIAIDDKIQTSQVAFFDNGIFPSVVITIGQQPHPSGQGMTRPRLNAAQRREVYGAIRKVSGGIANYGNPAIIDGLIERIDRLSATQNEMGWEKSEKTVRTRILSAFGVHPYILGEEVAGSYAQAYNVQERFFSRVNTFLNLLSALMTRLGNAYFGEEAAAGKAPKANGKPKFKVQYMPCKATDPSMEKTTWEAARNRDDVTQNEFRAWMGLPPDEDKQEAIMNKTLAAPVTAIAEKATSGAITPEQALAMLTALGLPEDVAKEIAGEGAPEPPKGMVSGGPGKPPVPDPTKLPPAPPPVPGTPAAVGPTKPGKPGGKPLAGPPKKPVGAADAAKKALQEAAAALRLEQPLDEEVREILEIADFKGGPGSGDWGHQGRPGQVGGSGGGGGHHTLPEGHQYHKPKPKPTEPDFELNVPSLQKSRGSVSVQVKIKETPKVREIADEVRSQISAIPPEMRLSGGSGDRITIAQPGKGANPNALGEFVSAGKSSPSGYCYVYPKKGESPQELGATAVHEYSHGVDKWLGTKNNIGDGWLSSHEGFQAAMKNDVGKLSDRDKFINGYIIDKPREIFAETYARMAGAKRDFPSNEDYFKSFPTARKWIEEVIK